MAEIANLNTRLSLESASFLSGVEKSRGALRSLISSLDPVAAATAKYNRQVQLLEAGMKRGTLTADQHGAMLQRLTARYQEQVRNQGQLTGSTGMMRSGMQQLSFQLGDVATQFASGTRPMIIFAQQGGQVIQAVQMMTNSSKGFLGFLGGPWGQVITAAIVVLTALSSKLFDNADAANAAADGVDNYTDALKSLQEQAGSFSFGSAEFSRVNKELLETEARVARLRQEARTTPDTPKYMVGPDGLPIRVPGLSRRAEVGSELRAAEADLERIRGEFQTLFIQRRNREIADRREPRKTRERRGPADRTDQREERFDDQIARLKSEQVGLQMALTSDLAEKARLQRQQVDAEVASYEEDLKHQVAQKEITAERAEMLLNAKRSNALLEKQIIDQRLADQITEDTLQYDRQSYDGAIERAQDQLAMARTQKERRELQLKILDLETWEREAAAEAVLAKRSSTEAEKAIAKAILARLPDEKARKASMIEGGTLGPLTEYLDRLPKSALELNEAYERVAAEGLASVTDGLADAITGARSLGDVFSDVADQIINDLARIAVQKLITAPLANTLFGSFGGGLDLGALNTTIASNNAALNAGLASMPRFATGGSLKIGGRPGIDRNVLSINATPVAMVSRDETLHVRPSNDNGRAGIVINQTFAPNLAGNAATHEEMVRFGALVKSDTIRTFRDLRSRGAI